MSLAKLYRSITIVVALVACSSAMALDINYPRKGVIKISGTFVAGDAENLAKAMQSNWPLVTLYVDSPGGSIDEALRIAALVKYLRLMVAVPAKGICASSCFLVYISAHDRMASGYPTNGFVGLDPYGYVGLHRPYLNPVISRGMSAQDAMSSQSALMSSMQKYLQSQLVPQLLIDKMMVRASNEVYWMPERELRELGEYSPEFEEILITKCGYRKDQLDRFVAMQLAGNSSQYLGELKEFLSCMSVAEDSLFEEQLANYTKLRKGGRPWRR